jgi:Ca2+-dependent lipid-binding protein
MNQAGLKPKWDQVFDVKVTNFDEGVHLECYDSGATSDEIIGSTTFQLKEF